MYKMLIMSQQLKCDSDSQFDDVFDRFNVDISCTFNVNSSTYSSNNKNCNTISL
jgi:hypothetical protein